MNGIKLRGLQRQMGAVHEEHGDADAGLYAEKIIAAVRNDAQKQIDKAQGLQEQAEQAVKQLEHELRKVKAQAAGELARVQNEHAAKLQEAIAQVKQQKDKALAGQASELERLRRECITYEKALANEQRLRAVAEVERNAAQQNCTRLEGVNKELKNTIMAKPKGAPAPVDKPMKGATATVTKRDQQGRIISFEIKPTN